MLGIYPKGWRIPLTYRRGAVEREIVVRLTGVHPTKKLVEMIQGPSGPAAPDGPPNPRRERRRPGEPGAPDDEEKPRSAPVQPVTLPAANVPKKYSHMFEKKYGFVNYYFNRLKRDQIWKGMLQHGDFSKQDPTWRLTGTDGKGKKIEIVLGELQSGFKSEEETWVVDTTQNLADQIQEDNSGLLVAMHVWRKMLVEGPERFGQVHYFGSVPLFNRPAKVDILVGTIDITESNFMFDDKSRRLVAMEMFGDVDELPHELNFEDFQIDGQLSVPGLISYAYGDTSRQFRITQIEFIRSSKETDE